ncbi:hypothetical protein C8F01DRAFT_1376681 [Mycena amicta]|nr:hypothetical protein C8F01DRAFT_1376681 [Mycena amicta]
MKNDFIEFFLFHHPKFEAEIHPVLSTSTTHFINAWGTLRTIRRSLFITATLAAVLDIHTGIPAKEYPSALAVEIQACFECGIDSSGTVPEADTVIAVQWLRVCHLLFRRFAISAYRRASLPVLRRALEFAMGKDSAKLRASLLPVCYTHLDSDNIPTSKDFENGYLDSQTLLAVIKATLAWDALFAIFDAVPKETYPLLWPRISQWAVFFDAHQEQLPSKDAPSTTFLFMFVHMASTIFRAEETIKHEMLSTRSVIMLLGRAWAIFATLDDDKELRHHERVLHYFLALPHLAESVGGTIHDIGLFLVRCIYAHSVLRVSSSCPAEGWYTDRLLQFLGDIDGFSICSHNMSLASALARPITPLLAAAIRHKLVYHLVRITVIVCGEDTKESVNHYLMLVLRILLHWDASALHEALDGGLLRVLAMVAGWGEENTTLTAQCVRRFLTFIPSTLVYHKTLTIVQSGLEQAKALYMSESFRMSYIGPQWFAMMELLQSRMGVFRAISTPDSEPRAACDNLQCAKMDRRSSFQRCSGCTTFYYCSETCQRTDWFEGGHRSACQLYEDLIPNENADGLPSSTDRAFLRALLQTFYTSHYTEFYTRRSLALDCDSDVLAIPIVDFTSLSDPVSTPATPTVKVHFLHIGDDDDSYSDGSDCDDSGSDYSYSDESNSEESSAEETAQSATDSRASHGSEDRTSGTKSPASSADHSSDSEDATDSDSGNTSEYSGDLFLDADCETCGDAFCLGHQPHPHCKT